MYLNSPKFIGERCQHKFERCRRDMGKAVILMDKTFRLHFFPAGLPDETLHSRVSRYHCMSGNLHDRHSLQDLFGSHTFAPTSNLPSHLLALCNRLPEQMACSPDELLEEATLFPYFRPFLTAGQVSVCRQAMFGVNAGELKISMGMVASRIGCSNTFRYCQSCMRDDEVNYGIAYWHRTHQLPGNFICAYHYEPLLEIDHYWLQSHKHNLFLPTAPEIASVSILHKISSSHVDYLTKIALASAYLLTAREQVIERADLCGFYRDRALAQGWISERGRVRVDDLRQVANRCAELIPDIKSFQFISTREHWILALVRKHRSSMHPLKHLVLLTLLQSDWANLSGFCRHFSASKDTRSNRTLDQKCKLPSNFEQMFSESSFRPKLLKGEKLKEAKFALATADPLHKVAQAQGISIASIYRLLRRYPQVAQKRQEQLREVRRRRFAEELKVTSARAAQDYMWLYRNDYDWLHRTIFAISRPVREPLTTVDWSKRDKQTAQALRFHARQLYAKTPPIRVSKSQLAKAIGEKHFIEKYIDRLPATALAVNMFAETVENFQKRRIAWAVDQVRKSGASIVAWRITRLAGMKEPLTQELKLELCRLIEGSASCTPVDK